jgi:hypothetical protein
MVIGYKKTFSAYVQDGSKPHTLRLPRKKLPKIGEAIHEYEAIRTKYTKLIRRDRKYYGYQEVKFKVVKGSIEFWADGQKMPHAALHYLVWKDGFRNGLFPDWDAFRNFFGLIWEGNFWAGHIYHATSLIYTPEQDWIEKLHEITQLKIEFVQT